MSKNPSQLNQIRQNIRSLEGEMTTLNSSLDLNPEDLFPTENILPGINDIEIFDYQAEIEAIKLDSEETLSCLSSLYLNADDLEKKNISNIIHNDALALADLKFSLFCSKRGLINLMKQLDMGINDPEMYEAVGTFQKEIRDSIKMLYDIQKKMKDFYKDIRQEMSDLNAGTKDDNHPDVVEVENTAETINYNIVDLDELHNQIDEFMKNKNKK